VLAERNPVNSTRLSLPLVLAAVFLAALTVSATDDWAVDGAAWIVLQRESDTVLLERTCGLLRLPAAAGVGLFVVITIDPHICTIASPPREISYPVERVPCADSGLRPTMAVKNGQICLRREDARAAALPHPASVERVDLALVPAGFAVGSEGQMLRDEVSPGLMTRARFVRPIELTPD
jgi:hypothetical protein